jgi:ferredoxin
VLASRPVIDETQRESAEELRGKAVIDREACMGSGNCVYWAPAVFDLDDDGIAIVVGEIAGNEELVRVAIVNCPTAAIHIVDA